MEHIPTPFRQEEFNQLRMVVLIETTPLSDTYEQVCFSQEQYNQILKYPALNVADPVKGFGTITHSVGVLKLPDTVQPFYTNGQ